MRTFMRVCVKFMALACLAYVPIGAYRVSVELAAGNLLGALFPIAFAAMGAVLSRILWTHTDGVVEAYMAGRPSRGPDDS